MIRYFTYGSNMDKEDLDIWCRSQRYTPVKFISVCPAKLNDYKLCFNYFSVSRNGGAANIMESKGDCIYGLLVEIKEDDLETIRRKEGYPDYYNEICVNAEKFDGTVVRDVKTYKVVKHLERPDHQPPTEYYLQLIIKNAKIYGFPADYIRYLESIVTKD